MRDIKVALLGGTEGYQTANQSAMQSLRATLVPTTTDEKARNRTTGADKALNGGASAFAAVGLGDNFKYANEEEEEYPDRKRAIVLIRTGEKASNTTLVERFVWSARNIGNYRGWIVLITDADEERYANLAVAAMPTTNNTTTATTTANNKITVTTAGNYRNTNTKNRFLVFRKQEKRFARITRFRKFHDTNTMNSKIFKTYILQYAKTDMRLNNIELFCYLDVDIVFGNSIRPLFDDLETRYNIGVSESLSQTQLSPDKENSAEAAKIYFFEGNGSQQIQGGQFVLGRKTSQFWLDRWRFLMQKQRQKRFLKDQTSLTMMLNEQEQRLLTSAAAAADDANSTITDIDSNSTEGGRPTKHCEIILMKQDKKLIQFPELVDIQKRLAKTRKNQPEYPTLVHFRNSANVMKNVEEETFQRYVRDILRFEEDQKDDLGILNKMLMQRDPSKKSF